MYNSAWQVLETRETATESAQPESLQPKYQYVWSLRYIDSPILRDENTDQDSLCDDDRLYYLTDANFNVTSLVDTAGDAVERYVYPPYGTPTIYDGTWTNTRSTTSYANNILYTGREYDGETGLYHYRNRFYAPHLGAFISRDPIGYRGDTNFYEYVGDNPVVRTDPNGLFWPEVYENGDGQVCGYSIWLLTGSWCADPDVVIAATDGYDKYRTCWWDCEVSVHKCVTTYVCEAGAAACTTAFTHLEIAKGPVRRGLGTPGDVTTLQSALAFWMTRHGFHGAAQQILRQSAQHVSGHAVTSGITSAVAGIAIVETTIAWACAFKCS